MSERHHARVSGRNRRPVAVLLGVATVVTALTLSACAPGGAASPGRADILRVGVHSGTTGDQPDPHVIRSGYESFLNDTIYERLVENDQDFELQYVLAESLEPNAAATDWTLRLKPGITFTDGSALTVDDVVFTFDRIKDPDLGTISGSTMGAIASMEKVDDLTVVFHLSTPMSWFPQAIADGATGVVPEGFDVSSPVSTGAWRFQSFEPGVESRWTRYDGYHGEPAKVAELALVSLADDDARVNALVSGQVDVATEYPNSRAAELEANPAYQLLNFETGNVRFFAMRTDEGVTADPRVREAVRMSVDRTRILDVIYQGYGTVANDLYGRYDPAFDDGLVRERDLAAARDLVRAAGAEGADLVFTTDLDDEATGQILAQGATEIGLNASVQALDGAAFGQGIFEWQVGVSEFPSASILTYASTMDGPNASFNQTHFSDPEYDALYVQASAALNEQTSADALARMQRILFERGGLIVPVFPNSLTGVSATTTGWPTANESYAAIGRSLKNISFTG